jgi:drug/metabolite transporter (DMT)-like permease
MTHSTRPPTWAVVLAFALVYTAWGTTYLAIKEGVKNQHLPPALFGGVRVCLAGLLLLAFLAWRGVSVRLSGRDLARVAVTGVILFVAGNGLITVAEQTVPSGVAAVLASTTPLWMGLLGLFWAGGERLSARGWLGLVVGMSGVVVLLAPRLQEPRGLLENTGVWLVLGSAASWALGSLVVRHRPTRAGHLAAAAYQMVIGGGGLALVGLAVGEAGELTTEHITPGAAFAFFYLLIVGSLVGFVAFNWLLGHVPAAQVSTYAYVNPVVAILAGWLLGNEELTGWIVGGMAVILAGVALVRGGQSRPRRQPEKPPQPLPERGAKVERRGVTCRTGPQSGRWPG